MATSSRDRISVDLHGLGVALAACAQARRVSVSALVRQAVERELGLIDGSAEPGDVSGAAAPIGTTVKLSIRLTSGDAEQLDARARQAGLSRGAFLAGLLADVPSLSGGAGNRLDCLAALTASCAELSTLSRNINHLTVLLRQGEVLPAQQYRRMLDTLGEDVRKHLRLAAGVLADLRPARTAIKSAAPTRPAAA